MICLIATAMVIAVLYLSYGVLFYGLRNSLSRLGVDWNKWLFTLFIWTETLLVTPAMFDATQENVQWLVFFIAAGLTFVGGASLSSKDEEKIHTAGAVVSCIGSLVWLGLVNPVLLIVPLFAVIIGGTSYWQWAGEIGIMLAIFLALF